MKNLLLGIFLFLPIVANAHIECGGETYKGDIVLVTVITSGSLAYPAEGKVEIYEKSGKQSSYTIKKSEIAQFFERIEGNADQEKALAFLSAFADLENPISIRYIGTNYTNDLIKVLRDKNRKKEPNNEMRVWKGPGFSSSQQYQFTDVVCNIGIDP